MSAGDGISLTGPVSRSVTKVRIGQENALALRLKVTYVDGREATALASPRAQVMTERKFPGMPESSTIELGFYMAWASLHTAGLEPADFDAWLDLVADVEQDTGNGTSAAAATD